ncbi:N-acetylglucosamine-6-phosphate deacetylase [Parashewanella spongiae]|uniref:N-acetylgalactosamine-6-phosphate deacetylase n=1 Tax=Parashewanella spongiae TaxID=342950 RepID=A0A3A6TZ59_9GAMM|nr:N-acetylglucosamine-6-phosphate deacetylase [Parashewanella spongiae]MCL1077950.1 N-acetylglucosamine-6-phosphate deacetylase [Parashewanella spongiae]RJY18430.1 N-acetylglucosamine-6-phosphate deacetylase [Parashewanella spongiae]
MKKALINATVFDGEQILSHHSVLIENNLITAVQASDLPLPNVDEVIDLSGSYLTSGFIDLQVNGGGGMLFNENPTIECIQCMTQAHRKYGTTALLPTLITDDYPVMSKAIDAVKTAIANNLSSVLGIHLEGPFLNVQKKGAHDSKKIKTVDAEGIAMLTQASKGITIATIAPETFLPSQISMLKEQGVIICAGHSAANYEQTKVALQAGVTGFTHLFNAMTPFQSRDPGMVGAALEDENSWFGIIADGHHVHPASLNVAIKAKKRGKAILVTDAMPTVGSTNASFTLNGEEIFVKDGKCINAAGSLAGSDLNMISAIKNTSLFTGLHWTEAVRMATVYPARAIGMENKLGFIKKGYIANLVALSPNFDVEQTWVAGC